MKILFVDNGNNSGHVNFNTIHLSALNSLNVDVDVVFNWHLDSQYEHLNVYDNINVFYLPKYLCYNVKSKLGFRLYAILQLWYIYIFFNRKKYDYVILSSYDAITLFFAGYSSKYLIFNHNNIAQLSNKTKLFFTKCISSKCIHLVFNDDMKDEILKKIPYSNVKLISHGCVAPFSFSSLYNSTEGCLKNKIIFCPSTTSVDYQFLQTLISSDALCNYLEINNIQIFIRCSKFNHVKNKNITILDNYLPFEEYRNLFLNSHAILIPYSSNFKFRTSGVLFECFANNKPFIASKIPALEIYSSFVNYDSYFSNIEELILIMDKLLAYKGNYFKNVGSLMPVSQWEDILGVNVSDEISERSS